MTRGRTMKFALRPHVSVAAPLPSEWAALLRAGLWGAGKLVTLLQDTRGLANKLSDALAAHAFSCWAQVRRLIWLRRRRLTRRRWSTIATCNGDPWAASAREITTQLAQQAGSRALVSGARALRVAW